MTKKERREKLKVVMTPDYLDSNTNIFNDPIGSSKLDPYTVKVIKDKYRLYYNSWVAPEMEELIK